LRPRGVRSACRGRHRGPPATSPEPGSGGSPQPAGPPPASVTFRSYAAHPRLTCVLPLLTIAGATFDRHNRTVHGGQGQHRPSPPHPEAGHGSSPPLLFRQGVRGEAIGPLDTGVEEHRTVQGGPKHGLPCETRTEALERRRLLVYYAHYQTTLPCSTRNWANS